MSTAAQGLNKFVTIVGPAVVAFDTPAQKPFSYLLSVYGGLQNLDKLRGGALAEQKLWKRQVLLVDNGLKLASLLFNKHSGVQGVAAAVRVSSGIGNVMCAFLVEKALLKTASAFLHLLSDTSMVFSLIESGSALQQKARWFKEASIRFQCFIFGFQAAAFLFEIARHTKKLYSKWRTSTWEQRGFRLLKITAKSALTYVAFSRFSLAYHELQKITDVVQRCFVLVRVAQHDKEDKLTDKGAGQVTALAEKISDGVVDELLPDEVTIICSGRACAQEMAKQLDTELKEEIEACGMYPAEVEIGGLDVRLNGIGGLDARLKEYESGEACYERTRAAIDSALDRADEDTLTVVVTHQANIVNFFRGLPPGEEIPVDWRSHHAVSGEMYLVARTDGVYSALAPSVRPQTE